MQQQYGITGGSVASGNASIILKRQASDRPTAAQVQMQPNSAHASANLSQSAVGFGLDQSTHYLIQQ